MNLLPWETNKIHVLFYRVQFDPICSYWYNLILKEEIHPLN